MPGCGSGLTACALLHTTLFLGFVYSPVITLFLKHCTPCTICFGGTCEYLSLNLQVTTACEGPWTVGTAERAEMATQSLGLHAVMIAAAATGNLEDSTQHVLVTHQPLVPAAAH